MEGGKKEGKWENEKEVGDLNGEGDGPKTLIPRIDLVLKTKDPLFIGSFQIMILAGSRGSGLLFIKNIERAKEGLPIIPCLVAKAYPPQYHSPPIPIFYIYPPQYHSPPIPIFYIIYIYIYVHAHCSYAYPFIQLDPTLFMSYSSFVHVKINKGSSLAFNWFFSKTFSLLISITSSRLHIY